MADEKPKTALKIVKPLTKRPSKGFRKCQRRRKEATRNPLAGNG
jgi:hypothetical protein